MTLGMALALGVVTAVANLLGGLGAVLGRRPSSALLSGAMGFGGGFLLGAALLEMLPEALGAGPWTPLLVLAGYFLVFLVEQVLNVHLHRLPEAEANPHSLGGGVAAKPSLLPLTTGVAALVALNVHDFLDGLAIGAGAVETPALGWLAFLAVLAHEVPAGFVAASLMVGAGKGPWVSLLAAASIGAVTLLGIALPFLVGEVNPGATAALLAMATGSFLYVGATILIPLSEAGGARQALVWVAVGLALAWGTQRALSWAFPG